MSDLRRRNMSETDVGRTRLKQELEVAPTDDSSVSSIRVSSTLRAHSSSSEADTQCAVDKARGRTAPCARPPRLRRSRRS